MHCSTLECELFTCYFPFLHLWWFKWAQQAHLAMDSLCMWMFLQIQTAPSVEPQIAYITHWSAPVGAVHCSHKETFVLILCILFPAPLLLNATGPCIFLIMTGHRGQGPVYTATHLHQHSLQVSLCCVITTGLLGQGPVYTATHLHQHYLQVSLCHHNRSRWPGTSLHCHPLTGLNVLCDHNRSEARDQFTLPPTLLTGPIHVITGSVNWK